MFSNEKRYSIRNSLALALIASGLLILLLINIDVIPEIPRICYVPPIENLSLAKGSNNSTEMIPQRLRRLPQAIVIGARKSGTRALLKFLEVNPSIRAAQNEIHFFDKSRNYELGLDWYRNQMPESSNDEITIEKSPAYLVTTGVPERIRSMNNSIKLIIILREPVIRLISDYSQLVANKIGSLGGTNEEEEDDDYTVDKYFNKTGPLVSNSSELIWKRAEKEFEDYVLRPDGGIDDQRHAVRTGMYSVHLERWRALFPINQMHVVDGEMLIKDPFVELHKLELFLGLKPRIKRENLVYNPRKGFFCFLTDSQLSKPIHLIKSIISNSADSLHTNITNTNCLSKSKGRRHVVVKQKLIDRLERFYAPFNEYLFSLIGQNLNWSRIQ